MFIVALRFCGKFDLERVLGAFFPSYVTHFWLAKRRTLVASISLLLSLAYGRGYFMTYESRSEHYMDMVGLARDL